MENRVLLITGASSGIGEATARAAVAAGWSVVVSARSEDKLERLAAELGDRALAVRCDVTEWDEQVALVDRAVAHFGRIDAAWANAGFGGERSFFGDSPERWKSMVLTNVYGAALTFRATIPALKASHGHLLITGSIAGRRAIAGSLYSATKHAAHAMAESARQELNGTGVRVTVIAPGVVDTPFFANVPIAEPLHADDIARGVMFALSQPPHVDVNEVVIRPVAQEL